MLRSQKNKVELVKVKGVLTTVILLLNKKPPQNT